MTKDATIEIVGTVEAHPDADRLDLVKIMGYQCVTQRGLYKGGEKIVYIKPDALLPVELWTEEYRKYSPKRIKAVRLRGMWSEGIIVPFEILPNGKDLENLEEGTDVSELIGVTHYEMPTPNDIQAKGGLPFGIPKTDEDRCLSEETIIHTEDGLKTIKEICDTKYVGKVKSYNTELSTETFENIIGHSIMNNNNDWYKITLENGQTINGTSNEKLYLPGLNCFREIKDLTVDDLILLSN